MFDPALAFDPSSIDALVGAKIPPKLDLPRYLDGMSNVAGVAVYESAASKRIEVVGKAWGRMLKAPMLSMGMERGELGTIIDVEVAAVGETPRDEPAEPITLARVPMAILVAEADRTLAPEFYMDTNLPEVQYLAECVGSLLLDGIIDFHGASGNSPHE